MSFLNSNRSNSKVTRKLAGMSPQSSLYGVCLPLVYGTARIPGNVIWFGDWQAKPVETSGKGGSKGSSKGGGEQQYQYKCALIIGLCQGPVTKIGNVWMDKTKMQLAESKTIVVVPPGGVVTPPIPKPGQPPPPLKADERDASNTIAYDMGVSRADTYNMTGTDYGAPAPFTLTGIQYVPLTGTAVPILGPGQYYFNPNTGTYTFHSSDVGKIVHITYRWNDKNSSVLGAPDVDLNFTFFNGAQGQQPWGYLSSSHGDQALGYTNLAYLASSLMDLGTSGMVSNYNWEVFGLCQFGGGIGDANPADIIYDFLTNTDYGCQWPTDEIGDLSELDDYCRANGIFLSPLLDNQRPAGAWVDEWLEICNCAAFYSEGKIKVRSFGDQTAIGNGATFTPYNTPVYDLDDDDYIGKAGESPFSIERTDTREIDNKITIEWMNRGNDYHAEPAYQLDEWHIQKYGLHARGTVTAHSITSAQVAGKYASNLLKRSIYIRNTSRDIKIQLTAGALLEPMDLITITNPYIGWMKMPVRVLAIEEDDNYILTLEVEEFPWGNATPALYGKQVSSSFGPGYFEPPSAVHTPIFFEPTIEMDPSQQMELTIGLAGTQKWGGASIYMSIDGMAYDLVGKQTGTSNLGQTMSVLAPHVDPDDSGSFVVNMAKSNVQLQSVSADQKDAFFTLLLVGRELISYQNATLTGANTYTLAKLRRGVYGTPIENHPIGTPIELFDTSLYTWTYMPSDMGRQHWFKFTSVNRAGVMEEDLANVVPYPYYVEGPRRPYPLHADTEATQPNDPWYVGTSFAIRPAYIKLSGGRGNMARMLFTFAPAAATSFSVTAPPTFTLTTSTTGGTLPDNTWVAIGMTAYQPDPGDQLETMLSPLTAVKTGTSGSNTNSVSVAYTFNAPADHGYIYAAYPNDFQGMWRKLEVGPNAGTGIVTNVAPIGKGPPDGLTDNYIVRGCWELHAGIWAAAVNVVGPHTLEFGGCNFAVNSLNGRIISLLGKYNNAVPTPILNARITSNTADVITTDLDLSALGVEEGDVFVIRTQAQGTNPYAVTDPLWVNGGSGQDGTGLRPGAEAGKVLWVIAGIGAGQFRVISDNDAATIYITEPWEVQPNLSTFIVIEPGWSYAGTTKAAGATVAGNPITAPLNISNLSQTYIFQVLTVDTAGSTSDERYSPWREVYLWGNGVNRNIVDGDYTLTPEDQEVTFLVTADATCTMLPTVYVADQEFTINNDAGSTGNVHVVVMGDGTVSSQDKYTLLPGDSVVIKAESFTASPGMQGSKAKWNYGRKYGE